MSLPSAAQPARCSARRPAHPPSRLPSCPTPPALALPSARSLVRPNPQDDAAVVVSLPRLANLEVRSATTSFLSLSTLMELSGAACPLTCLSLGPCVLNPSPSMLGLLGGLPRLVALSASVKCASAGTAFSDDSLAVRCGGAVDTDGLTSLRSLTLALEGYSEARAVRAVSGCLAGLTNLELLLRGMWQPAGEELEARARAARASALPPASHPLADVLHGSPAQTPQAQVQQEAQWRSRELQPLAQLQVGQQPGEHLRRVDGAHLGASTALPWGAAGPGGNGSGVFCGAARAHLVRLVLRDERPEEGGQPPAGVTVDIAPGAWGGGALQPLVVRGSDPPGRGGGGQAAAAAAVPPLLQLLRQLLQPCLRELELSLGPHVGCLSLGQVAATCPQLSVLRVTGHWLLWGQEPVGSCRGSLESGSRNPVSSPGGGCEAGAGSRHVSAKWRGSFGGAGTEADASDSERGVRPLQGLQELLLAYANPVNALEQVGVDANIGASAKLRACHSYKAIRRPPLLLELPWHEPLSSPRLYPVLNPQKVVVTRSWPSGLCAWCPVRPTFEDLGIRVDPSPSLNPNAPYHQSAPYLTTRHQNVSMLGCLRSRNLLARALGRPAVQCA
eukprot:360591-Chlamydomonas_euryale.AAC.6